MRPFSLAKQNVLLVEDDPPTRQLVRALLERSGSYAVVEAGDGLAGIEHVKKTQPDVILLDLFMPSMGGFEALPHLRRLAPDSRIIILSMVSNPDIVQGAMSMGADGFVDKGIPNEGLVPAIRQAVLQPRESPGRTLTMQDLLEPTKL